MSERTHFVYEAYDADGLLLYVGCTSKPSDRYRAHMAGCGAGTGWFDAFVTHWAVSGPYPKATALRMERERIAERKPIWNAPRPGYAHDRKLINQYLAYHGYKFVPHPTRSRPLLVPTSKRRRLRVVA